MTTINETVSEGIGAGHSSILTGWLNSASDRIAFDVSKIKLSAAIGVTLSQGIGAASTITYTWRPGATISEIVGVLDAATPTQKLKTTLVEILGLSDAAAVARQATLSDTVGMASTLRLLSGALILDQLRLLPELTPTAKYAQTLVQALQVNDALARFIGAFVSEGVGTNEALGLDFYTGASISEAIGVTEALTPRLVFRVTLDETVGLDDVDVLRMIFSPVLADGIEIGLGYLAPNGTFTTWAINTRTGATTEYQNYVFNSFAQRGHKYLGASSDGLYELNGDTDNGTDIIARLKSGFAQFAGSRFASFKTAYLGMRADGDVLFKIEAGDGATYTYQVVIQNTQTTRVRIGRGLRARYFSFELITTGQDFDLDTVEFVPIVTQRRV